MGHRSVNALMVCVMLLITGVAMSQSRWSEVPLPFVTTSLEHISFVDSVHGCLCDGTQGFFFYTSDNGVTWTADTIPAPQYIRKCTIVSENTIWAWGYKGTSAGPVALFLSTDRGQTWLRRDPPDTLLVRGLEFLSDNVVWLAGRSHLWVSEDGGASWQRRGAFVRGGSPVSFQAFECFDDSVGFVSGNAYDFTPQRTTDGGWTWEDFWIRPSLGGYGDGCGPMIFAGDGLCAFSYHYMLESSTERFSGIVLSWNRLRDTVHLRTSPYNVGSWAQAISRENIWLWDAQTSKVLHRTTDGGNTWMKDTFNVAFTNALYDSRGHRFVLASGRLFRLDENPPWVGARAFPLALGNVWHYRITYPNLQGPPTVAYTTVRVIGDTVMPGGKHFWVLDHADLMGGRYIRSDSGVVYYWDTNSPVGEHRLIDLTAKQGARDTIAWNGYFTSVAGMTYSTAIFGQPTLLRTFSLDGIVIGHLTCANGFGYSGYEFNGDSGSPMAVWELIGCRIAGVVYGTVDAAPAAPKVPLVFDLLQNYPNPFNPSTTIGYILPIRAYVTMTVCNTLGQQVALLQNGEQDAGHHDLQFNASNLPSGVYFYRLRAGAYFETRKCLLLR
jgi:hypothetical protein